MRAVLVNFHTRQGIKLSILWSLETGNVKEVCKENISFAAYALSKGHSLSIKRVFYAGLDPVRQ